MSTTPDPKTFELLRLIDQCILVIRQKIEAGVTLGSPTFLRRQYEKAEVNLRTLRDTTANNKLPRQSMGTIPPGTGFGVGKSMGEWCEDPEIMAAVDAIEDYFRYQY